MKLSMLQILALPLALFSATAKADKVDDFGRAQMRPAHLGIAVSKIPTVAGDLAAQTDRLFATWDKPNSPGCTLAVVKAGKTLYKHGYGMANLEYGVSNTPTTIFHIASTSKQFTAFAILLLEQEGKLSLDDDVRKYLPELHDFGKTITIRHLLHHTSGLRDQWNLLVMAGWRTEDVITEQDILDLTWRQEELNFEPGKEYLYCNTGYTLLGVIVKRVSGKSLNDFCHERIFGPLGMKHTNFHDDNHTIVPGRSYSYEFDEGGHLQNSPLQYATVGPTSLFTTVEDLALWDQNFYDAHVGGPTVITKMLQPGKLNDGKELDYACGLILGQYRGLRTVEHGGGDAGYRCTLLRFPDQHFSVVILANLATFNAGGLARQVAEIYLRDKIKPVTLPPAKPPVLPRQVKIDTKLYDTYVGDFELVPGFILTITKEGDHLMAQPTGQSKAELHPSAEREFFLKDVDAQLTFVKEKDGTVNQVVLHQGGRNLPAKRIQVTKISSAPLMEYVGDYYSRELRVIYTVTLRDGKLWVRYPRGEFLLVWGQGDKFSVGYPVATIRFTRNADKSLTGFLADSDSVGRVRNLRFTKVQIKSAPY